MLGEHWMGQDDNDTAQRIASLWPVWRDEMAPNADKTQSRHLFDQLMRRYTEPHRAYHTVTHLQELVRHYRQHEDKIQDRAAFLAILFYHDAIYTIAADRAGGLNETESAALALQELPQLGFTLTQTARVQQAIGDTFKHHGAEGDDEAALFMDMDMAILAAPWDEYLQYTRNIKHEYAPLISDQAFTTGRIGFLRGVLEQQRPIFTTPYYAHLQGQAMANMQAELDMLAGGQEPGPALTQ